MNEEEVERLLLEYAVEDDTGLWEIVWNLDYRFPDESSQAKREIAERCLRILISRGVIALLRGTTFQGDQTTIPAAGVDAALADEQWQPSVAAQEHTRFGATEAGLRAYYTRANAEHSTGDDAATPRRGGMGD